MFLHGVGVKGAFVSAMNKFLRSLFVFYSVPLLSCFAVPTVALASAYQDTIIADSPVAYWRMNTSLDLVGENSFFFSYDCGECNTVSPLYGRPGALANDTDKSVGFVNRSYGSVAGPALDITGIITVEAWVNIPNSLRDPIVIVKGEEGRASGYHLLVTSEGRIEFLLGGPNQVSQVVSPNPIEVEKWSHLVGTYDGNDMRLFINGIEVASKPHSDGINADSSELFIGVDSYLSGDTTPDAFIDEVAIYASALSAEQVNNHYLVGRDDLLDQDGMSDSWEQGVGLNVGVDDSLGDLDGDGLTNLQEYIIGTHPNTVDSDNDGMDDQWEVEASFDPLDGSDAAEDLDGDGVDNLTEYTNGTDPRLRPNAQWVTWIDHVNATSNGPTLSKVLPGSYAWDAGAVSVEVVGRDGAVEYTVTDEYALHAIGLSFTSTDEARNSIDYAIAVYGSSAQVLESGVAQGAFIDVEPGDVLGIERQGSSIVYKHNHAIFYTSTNNAVGHLIADASIYKPGEKLVDVRVLGAMVDSDSDGIDDSWEQQNQLTVGLDDSLADSDNDGLSNVIEYLNGTDPAIADSDADGIDDGWEVQYGLDPLSDQDAAQDQDGDGVSNLTEFVGGTDPGLHNDAQWVTWTDLINASADASGLLKIAGEEYTWDAGAASNEIIGRDGAVEFTFNGCLGCTIGLSYVNADESQSSINYALEMYGESVYVYEHGVLVHNYLNEQAGDVLRIERADDVVVYKLNGSIVYTSTLPSSGHLIVDASLYRLGAQVSDVRVYGGISDSDNDGMDDAWEQDNGLNPFLNDASEDNDADDLTNLQEYLNGTAPTIADSDADGMTDGWEVQYGLEPLSDLDATLDTDGDGITNLSEFSNGTDPKLHSDAKWVTWANLVNVEQYGSSLSKVSGAQSWDAGAASVQVFKADGAVEYTVYSSALSAVGLSYRNADVRLESLDYAIYINSLFECYIYEKGSSKGQFGAVNAGDVLRVERNGNVISYLRNGAVFYTSETPSSGATMIADASIYTINGRIDEVRVFGSDEDADSDQMGDAWEQQYGLLIGTNDGAGDLDSDGLTNLQEYLNGTNPTIVDSDNDGMDDGWEVQYELDPLNDLDAVGDIDGDGINNLAEFTSGSDPRLHSDARWVGWTEKVNVVAQGVDLAKDVSVSNGWNAGARSLEVIGQDGAVEYLVGDSTTENAVGLSYGNPDAARDSIDYAITTYAGGSSAFVREQGSSEGPTISIEPGDILRVERTGNVITYKQNNTVFYTSAVTSFGHLQVDSSIYGVGDLVSQARVYGAIDDVDGDGMDDAWEQQHQLAVGIDDASSDYDGDGLVNLQEYLRQTEPDTTDSDADGMADGWEVQYGLDPLDQLDATQDLDGDGLSNLTEFSSGTNPKLHSEATWIVWSDLVNVNVEENSIKKVSGSYGWNAGAASAGVIPRDGAVEYTFTDGNRHAIGLSSVNEDATLNSIDFAIYVLGDSTYKYIYVYEEGSYKGRFSTAQDGDVFKVERLNGTVSYIRNGAVFYTSAKPSTGDLVADASIYYLDHELADARLYGVLTDVDNDGMDDTWEALYGLTVGVDDGAGDLDSDGLVNRQEYDYDTSPTSQDTDADGMDDAWEVAYGLDPKSDLDAAHDADGDGVNNLTEFVNGTDPKLHPDASWVTWTDLVNVETNGASVSKNLGGESWNAGAASIEKIGRGGALELTYENAGAYTIGFSYINADAFNSSIDYAVKVDSASNLSIYERSVYRANAGSVQVGDTLRVERAGNVITYLRNGTVLYTSTVPSVGYMIVDSSIYTDGGRIADVRLFGAMEDADQDGMDDAWEQQNGLPVGVDDSAGDSDFDDLTNVQEYLNGTSPVTADSDGDGMDDGWEVQYQLDPLDELDATDDIDGDGENSLIEYSNETDPRLHSAAQWVAWTDLIKVEAAGLSLKKIYGGQSWNAGAASLQVIGTDGAVELTVRDYGDNDYYFGLSASNKDESNETIDYAFHVEVGRAEVPEQGGTTSTNYFPVQTGDTLRIERVGDTITYKHNGTDVYTSSTPSQGHLIADASIYAKSGQIYEARVYGAMEDSDNDGIEDAWEQQHQLIVGVDDSAADNDADGLTNLEEYLHSTDPGAPDSDADGMEDGWEVQYGLDPLSDLDAAQDLDGDGASNLTEFRDGTDPKLHSSAQWVNWKNLVNVEAIGPTLTKTGGDSQWDAGASSREIIGRDGAVEYTVVDPYAKYYIGLAYADPDVSEASIDYAIYAYGASSYVKEKGITESYPGAVQPGDVLRVERVGETVNYKVNGVIAYTSEIPSRGNLIVDTSIFGLGDQLVDVRVFGAIEDVDGDGMDDVWEQQHQLTVGVDDGLSDYDQDGLNNLQEYIHDTDPTLIDSDSDGIADGWEVEYALNPRDPQDAGQDPDGDGANNLTEFTDATDPWLHTDAQWASWIDLVNVDIIGNGVGKVSGYGYSWNAGAASAQVIPRDGAVEFSANGDQSAVGLSYTNGSASRSSIDFAIFYTGYSIYVYEKGSSKGYFGGVQKGDVLRIERIDGVISYKRNGTDFYSSTVPSEGDLVADVSIYYTDDVISDVKMYGVLTDTDNDRMDDTWEAQHGLVVGVDDGAEDADMDGLKNVDEYLNGTNPGVSDSDADGMDDGWEVQYGLDPVDAQDASQDIDGDTLSNLTEYQDGTDPKLHVDARWVNWIDRFNVDVSGATLLKIINNDGWNAGAVSRELIPFDGALEYTYRSDSEKHTIGFSYANKGVAFGSTDYALYVSFSSLYVNEAGVSRGSFGTVQDGDVLRVERVNDVVEYKLNGNVIYSSPTPADKPLIADALIYRGTVTDVRVFGAIDDADGDSMEDTWEQQNGLDPQSNDGEADPDGDGLSNLEEYIHQLSPLNPDTDADGMTDGWEVQHGLDPLSDLDATADLDGDGLSNLSEFTEGTDPWLHADAKWIEWQELVNVTAAGPSLTKTAGGSSWNAGAASKGAIPFDGAVEYTFDSDGDLTAIGLSNENADASRNSIGYAIYINGSSSFYVYEAGTSRGSYGSVQSGDVLRVERAGDTVTYRHNGAVFYSSTQPSSGYLVADTSIYDEGSKVDEARIYGSIEDADGDRLEDAWELQYGLTVGVDDSIGDADGDGLTNIDEYLRGTSPVDADTDADGMSDGWEVQYNLDPISGQDADSDSDNDGLTNLYEFDNGSDPALHKDAKWINWTDLTNVESAGNDLIKVAGGNSWNAGAGSTEVVPFDGAIEYVVDPNSVHAIGLSASNSDNAYGSIAYSVHINGSSGLYVYEEGLSRGNFGTVMVGDVLRIERVADTVYYKRNGATFYTSTIPSNGYLIADSSIYTNGGKIVEARVFGAMDDADQDLMEDAWEQQYGLNPISALDAIEDMDSDGLTNAQEFINRVDPGNPDSDGDGMTDGWEVEYGLDPRSALDAGVDMDGDGINNAAEFSNGTDPRLHVNAAWMDWTDLVNVEVSGLDLTKTSGSGWNAGAASVQLIPYDGAIEYVYVNEDAARVVGLSYTNTGVDFGSIDYAIYTDDYHRLFVYEGGVNRGNYGVPQRGDVFRVERQGETIYYKRNGSVFYTSTVASSGALIADVSVYTTGGQIDEAQVFGGIVDADRDLMEDAWEQQYGLVIGVDDSADDLDSDGLNNGLEYLNGTNPALSDSDADGMPDGWEVQYGLDPNDTSDAVADLDGDGVSNYDEYNSNTNPAENLTPEIFGVDLAPAVNNVSSNNVSIEGRRAPNTSIWFNDVEVVPLGEAPLWSKVVLFDEGVNGIVVTAKDATAGTSAPISLQFFVDSVAPSISGVTPGNAAVTNTIPSSIQVGFVEEGSGVNLTGSTLSVKRNSLSVSGDWTIQGSNLVFTPHIALIEGDYLVDVVLRDSLGHATSMSSGFQIDTTAPTTPVLQPVPQITSVATYTFSGTTEAGTSVWLNGQEIVGEIPDGEWSYTHSLSAGENRLEFAAMDKAGNQSAPASVTIVFDDTAPGAVTLAVDQNGVGTEVFLDWSGYDELANGGDIKHYAVYRNIDPIADISGLNPLAIRAAGTKTYHAKGLARGQTYNFAVVAVDASDNSLTTVPPIPVVSATPVDVIAPQEVTGLQVDSQEAELTLTWNPPAGGAGDLAGYNLYFNGGATPTNLAPSVTNHAFTGLDASTAYPVRITTVDNDGNESEGVSIDGVTLLNNPVMTDAVPYSGLVDLTWSQVEPATLVKEYAIYASTSNFTSVDGMSPALVVGPGTLNSKVAGLTNGTSYYFAVTAVNLSDGERMNVAPIAATPSDDLVGPTINGVQYGGVALNGGANLSESGTLTVAATDPSGVSKVEFNVDGALLTTDVSATDGFTASLNLLDLSDGAHTLSFVATDSLGNSSQMDIGVTVSLAAPPAPVIGFPVDGETVNEHDILVSGSATPGTEVQLYNNAVALSSPVVADGNGDFSANVTLDEGANSLNAVTQYPAGRGGASPFSAIVAVTVDSSIPGAPSNLLATARSGGEVKLTWRSLDERVVGYDLYRSTVSFTDITQAVKVNSVQLTGTSFIDLPEVDGTYYYRVVSVNNLGTQSEASAQVYVTSDSTAPSAANIQYSPLGTYDANTGRMAPGQVLVELTVSEPLLTTPFLSIVPNDGAPIPVSLTRLSDTEYSGSFSITEATPTGTAFALFSARDRVGNRGTDVDMGETIEIDADGPSVTSLIVAPSDPIKNDALNPAAVNFAITLDEAVASRSHIQLFYQIGTGAPIDITANLVQTGVLSWSGDFVLPYDAGQLQPETLSFVYSGTDDLGNVSTRIIPNNAFQVYQGDLPPLSIPTGLVAQALPNGQVGLTWDAVEGAAEYQLYRQGPGETALTAYQRAANTEITDSTFQDGDYAYAVASVRQANSQEGISAQSASVTVIADSVAPAAPQGFALSLVGSGVSATWQASAGESSAVYNLYRDSLDIVDVSALSPIVTNVAELSVLDPNPSANERYYAVTAVDAAGNESAPSDSVYQNVELLPIASLELVQIDDAMPVLSWAHGSATIAGYNLYIGEEGASGTPINAALISDTSYVDTGYAGDSRRYHVTAVDNSDVESVARELFLPRLSLLVAEGSQIQRGILNRLNYEVTNHSDTALTDVVVKVDLQTADATASYFQQSQSFSLSAGETKIIPVIVGGYADLADVTELKSAAEISSPGGQVRIERNGDILVSDSALVVDVATKDLVRGGSGQVRFSIENTSDVETEVVLGVNGNTSNEVRFRLQDLDGNVLSTASVSQQLGASVIKLASGATVARIAPQATFTSDWFDISVPATAPDDVVVRLEIDKYHYQHGKPEHVSVKGARREVNATLSDSPYYGELIGVTPASSVGDQDIVISGRAVDRADGLPVAYMPLKVVLGVNGFERSYEVVTDANGEFSYTFIPLPKESGIYTVSIVHPDVTDRPEQGQFVINRISFNPTTINLAIPYHYEQSINVRASGGRGDATVHELRLAYEAADQTDGIFPDGVTVVLGDTVQIASGENANLGFTLQASEAAQPSGSLALKVLRVLRDESGVEASTEHLANVRLNYTFADATPALYVTPNLLETGASQGDSINEILVLKNQGLAELQNINLALINNDGSVKDDWISLSTTSQPGNLAVGGSVEVGISARPPAGLLDGTYQFKLRVAASNYNTLDVPVVVHVTQSGLGQALFKVSDIYTATEDAQGNVIQGLANAKIYLQNERVPSVNYTLQTDANGEVLFIDVPAGHYKYRASASNHQEETGRLSIKPGVTLAQDVFLDYNLVTVEWSVTEITIEDRYEITLNATFETDVPAPVVVVQPGSVALPEMATGDVFQGEFTVTNHGLVRADNVSITLPTSDQNFRFEVLEGLPESLEAQQSVTVPYRAIAVSALDPAYEGDASGGGCSVYTKCINMDYDYECANGTVSDGSAKFCFSHTYGACGSSGIGGGGGSSSNIIFNLGGGSAGSYSPVYESISGVACTTPPDECKECCKMNNGPSL